MEKAKTAVIFVNGVFHLSDHVKSRIKNADILIAADGGLKHALSLGIIPQTLIGDLDSVSEDEINQVQQGGGEIIRFLPEKDETDLELAVDFAVRCGAKKISLVGAMGGRSDHWLVNIMLLTNPQLNSLDVSLIDGQEELFLIRGFSRINGAAGDLVSLIPITETVTGVSTTGLRYPLSAAVLTRYKTRGVSNEMLTSTAEISVENGLLLCVHNFQDDIFSQENN